MPSATEIVSPVRSAPQKRSIQESYLDLIQPNTFRRVLLHEKFEKFDSGIPFCVLVHPPWSPAESAEPIGTHGIQNVPIILANQPVQRKLALVLRVERDPAKKKAIKCHPQSPDINCFGDLSPRGRLSCARQGIRGKSLVPVV